MKGCIVRTSGTPSKYSPAKDNGSVDIDELMRDGTVIDDEAKRAVEEALLTHKKLGQSVVVWKDGKPVRLSPEEI